MSEWLALGQSMDWWLLPLTNGTFADILEYALSGVAA